MHKHDTIVAVYNRHTEVERAVKELQKSGFNLGKLSVIGKDYHSAESVVGYYHAGGRMKYWGRFGAFWCGMWTLTLGAAFFLVPGIGPVLVAGHLTPAILGVLEETALVVGGLTVIGAGLYSLGIPEDSIAEYEAALKADQFLLLVQGTADELAKAYRILVKTDPEEIQRHEGAKTIGFSD
jgi:hypothetical protein